MNAMECKSSIDALYELKKLLSDHLQDTRMTIEEKLENMGESFPYPSIEKIMLFNFPIHIHFLHIAQKNIYHCMKFFLLIYD